MDKAEDKILWEICIKTYHLLKDADPDHLNVKKFSRQREEILKLIEPLKNQPAFLEFKALELYEKGDFEEALKICEILPENMPAALEIKADIYLQKGEYEKSIEIYDRLLSLAEESPKYWFKKAMAYYILGKDIEDSVFYLERAIELNPDYIEALILMSKIWIERARKKKDWFIKKRMLKEASECLIKAEEQNFDEPSPIKEYNQAVIKTLMAKIEPDQMDDYRQEAISLLQEAIQKDPKDKYGIKEKIMKEESFIDVGIDIEDLKIEDVLIENMYPEVAKIQEHTGELAPTQEEPHEEVQEEQIEQEEEEIPEEEIEEEDLSIKDAMIDLMGKTADLPISEIIPHTPEEEPPYEEELQENINETPDEEPDILPPEEIEGNTEEEKEEPKITPQNVEIINPEDIYT